MKQDEIWEKINQNAFEWAQCSEETNDGRKRNLETEICNDLYRMFAPKTGSPYLDYINDFYLFEFSRYDPNKKLDPEDGSGRKVTFQSFFNYYFKKRTKDEYNYEYDEIAKKSKRHFAELKDQSSLEARVSEDSDVTMENYVGEHIDKSSEDYEVAVASAEDAMLKEVSDNIPLISLMLNLKSNLRGKSANAVRMNYYYLFFTYGVSYSLRTGRSAGSEENEQEICGILKYPFLDFTLTEICRTFEEISNGIMKRKGEMLDGEPMTEVKEPLDDIYLITYLRKVENMTSASAAAISVQRKALHDLLQQFTSGEIQKC